MWQMLVGQLLGKAMGNADKLNANLAEKTKGVNLGGFSKLQGYQPKSSGASQLGGIAADYALGKAGNGYATDARTGRLFKQEGSGRTSTGDFSTSGEV